MDIPYRIVVGIARSLFALQGTKFSIEGAENYPKTGGAVVMINHVSYLDFVYAGLPARKNKRLIRFMAKADVWKVPVLRSLMNSMKHVPVERAAGRASYKEAIKRLQEGEFVGVFPEATISRSFELKEFKTGGVRMALEAGVPIIPVLVWGSQRQWTKGMPKRMGRTKTPISVRVGAPIQLDSSKTPAELTTKVREIMRQMLDDLQQNYEPLAGNNLRFLPARLGGKAPTLEQATLEDRQWAAERKATYQAKKKAEAQEANNDESDAQT